MINSYGQLPSVSNTTTLELLSDYNVVQEMFYKECKKLSKEDLNKVVTYENGKNATIRWGIWHIADHSRYHQAHIVLLRKYYKQHAES